MAWMEVSRFDHRGEGLNEGDYEKSESGWAKGMGWGKSRRDVP